MPQKVTIALPPPSFPRGNTFLGRNPSAPSAAGSGWSVNPHAPRATPVQFSGVLTCEHRAHHLLNRSTSSSCSAACMFPEQSGEAVRHPRSNAEARPISLPQRAPQAGFSGLLDQRRFFHQAVCEPHVQAACRLTRCRKGTLVP